MRDAKRIDDHKNVFVGAGKKRDRGNRGGGGGEVRRHAIPSGAANGEHLGAYSVTETPPQNSSIAQPRTRENILLYCCTNMIAAGGQNDRQALSRDLCYCCVLFLFPRLLPGAGEAGRQAGRPHRTWMRSSSCRRTAFQTRMSATEHVMNKSEQPAGNMTSFTRAKWQVPRSSVSISIVTQYLFVLFRYCLELRSVRVVRGNQESRAYRTRSVPKGQEWCARSISRASHQSIKYWWVTTTTD